MLKWSGVRGGDVDGQHVAPEEAVYVCCECGKPIPHHKKLEMLCAGKWLRTNAAGKYPGFSISRLYSPDWSWGKIVTDPIEGFLQAKGDSARMQSFTNGILCEAFIEHGEAPDYERIMSRREDYRLGEVPEEVLFLTCGVDVQKTWLEGTVWGWGRGRQRWVIDHFRIEHGPYEQEAWRELFERLNQTYQHPGGATLPIARMAVDTGFASNEVYIFAQAAGIGRVFAVDGRDKGASLVGLPSEVNVTQSGRKPGRGCKLWPVNVSMMKGELYAQLGQPRPEDGEPFPMGWIHFPADLPEELFKQLCAEEMATEMVRGQQVFAWKKIRERNEFLDCANYARGAAAILGIDKFQETHWAQLEEHAGLTPGSTAAGR
jgi:phage terminase large subunit GpA-like protein